MDKQLSQVIDNALATIEVAPDDYLEAIGLFLQYLEQTADLSPLSTKDGRYTAPADVLQWVSSSILKDFARSIDGRAETVLLYVFCVRHFLSLAHHEGIINEIPGVPRYQPGTLVAVSPLLRHRQTMQETTGELLAASAFMSKPLVCTCNF